MNPRAVLVNVVVASLTSAVAMAPVFWGIGYSCMHGEPNPEKTFGFTVGMLAQSGMSLGLVFGSLLGVAASFQRFKKERQERKRGGSEAEDIPTV